VSYYNEEAEAPVDATIQYNAPERKFEVIPEVRGNTLDEEKIAQHVGEALASMQSELQLGEDDYKQPAVFQNDERLQAALAQAQSVLSTSINFTAHGRDIATLDGPTAASWVYTDESVQVLLDEDQVNEWVQKLVDKCGTVGNKRTWTREDGVTCTVEGGDYGWEADWLAVDEALHEYIYSGSAQTVEVPMQQEAAVYTGPNERDWKSYIDVDLDEQHATYYDDNGKVIWEADFVSGIPDGEHDTPQGVYYVNNKQSPAELVGDAGPSGDPEYRTKVEYWICWRGNDVGFHDADWQEAFGGTLYMDGNGSHGCINLSHEDVAELYKLADIDTVVVSHGANQPKTSSKSDSGEDEE
jgi:lipoprotein-anchoring transpeptidase ErfK/SrfK